MGAYCFRPVVKIFHHLVCIDVQRVGCLLLSAVQVDKGLLCAYAIAMESRKRGARHLLGHYSIFLCSTILKISLVLDIWMLVNVQRTIAIIYSVSHLLPA